MFHLPPSWRDPAALAACWRAAEPFPHVIVDDFAAPEAIAALLEIMDAEGVDRQVGDVFDFEASPPQPTTPELAAVRDELAAVLGPTLARATGKPAARVELRVYAYRAGHYLLPHSDHRPGLARALAFAYYLPSPAPPTGGELELYRCAIAPSGELTATESARVIEPRGNRLVIFDVSDVSLHQVREVVDGVRISLAGWFYPVKHVATFEYDVIPDAIAPAAARTLRDAARFTRYALLDRGSYDHAPIAELDPMLLALAGAATGRALAVADARVIRLRPGDYVLAHHDRISEAEEVELIADLSPARVPGADLHYRRAGDVVLIVQSQPGAVSIVVRDPRVTCHHVYLSKRNAPATEVVRLVVRLRLRAA